MRQHRMKRVRWLVALLGALALFAASCGDDDDDTADGDTGGAGGGLTEIGAGEGALSIVAWAGYIEDGTTDPAYDWVTAFETETGCEVTVQTAGTSDEMVSLMTGSDEYDLVTASGDASLRLIRGGTVQPVNLDLIASYSTVDERLKGAPWYTVDGVAYGVPYVWGSNVLMYNTEVFAEPPESWSVVFEEQTLPDGESNSGRVQAYDGAIYLADAALYLKATQPDLGIDDPYALSQEQFDAVIALLEGQNGLVNGYWHDVVAQIEDFGDSSTVASGTWPYQVNALAAEGAAVASTVPAEGATGWADTTMLHTNAAHPNCAYLWMEHSLDPVVQGDVASWFGAAPSVPAACEASELLGPDGCATNNFNEFDSIAFWKTPEANCFGEADEGACVPYSTWVSEYQRIMGS